jgi:hypothetical protein
MAVDRNYFMQQHYFIIYKFVKKNKSSFIKIENEVLLKK